MNKTEKLKMVFDFIADYLSEEDVKSDNNVNEEVSINETEDKDSMKRAYTIMKKVDEIDKVNAKVNRSVAPYKEELTKIKHQSQNDALLEKMVASGELPSDELTNEREGVTFDDNAELMKVKVNELNKNN
jgi:hypothetical protein